MKRFAAAFVLIALASSTARPDEKALKALEGSYRAIAMTQDGKDAPADFIDNVKLKIAGDELTFSVKDKTHPAKIKLDPTKTPATIDIAPSDGPEKGRTFLGIYRLDPDGLVLAFAEKGERPTAFKGQGHTVLVRLKRDDPKK